MDFSNARAACPCGRAVPSPCRPRAVPCHAVPCPCLPQLIAHFFADRCTHSRLTDSAARSCKAEGGSRVACCRCALRVVGSTSRGLCLHRTLHGARLHGCRAQSRHVGRHCCAFHRRSAVATVQRIFVGNRASATHIRRCGPMWKPTGRPPLPRCCCGSDDRLPSQAKQNSTPPEATLRPPARGGGFHWEVSRRDREAVGGPDRVLECDHPSAHAADPQRFSAAPCAGVGFSGSAAHALMCTGRVRANMFVSACEAHGNMPTTIVG
jgi:hypothetical protein